MDERVYLNTRAGLVLTTKILVLEVSIIRHLDCFKFSLRWHNYFHFLHIWKEIYSILLQVTVPNLIPLVIHNRGVLKIIDLNSTLRSN